MKLLSKQAVNVQVAAQKKVQVDEGVAIARKVDALRENLNKLELQHENFIKKIKVEADEMTTRLFQRIKDLKEEIKVLEQAKKDALVPLDEAWIKYEEAEEKLQVLMADAVLNEERTKKARESAETKLIEAKDVLGRIKIRERELVKAIENAETDRSEAAKTKDMANGILAAAEVDIVKRVAAVIQREEGVDNGEKANINYRELLDRRNLELNDRERLINDRSATLERSINRLKQ